MVKEPKKPCNKCRKSPRFGTLGWCAKCLGPEVTGLPVKPPPQRRKPPRKVLRDFQRPLDREAG